jgi:putative Mg2+ transporter-C (MgtC) family protein
MWTTPEFLIFAEILLAGLFGGLIGLERELADKPAGLRTHILVAMTAALLVALGGFVVREADFPNAVTTDPVRIIEAIIVGISFLGAGTILQRAHKGRVEGLTTAASILATAAIGIAVSLQLIWLAALTTLAILVVNRLLNPLEKWLKDRLNGRISGGRNSD